MQALDKVYEYLHIEPCPKGLSFGSGLPVTIFGRLRPTRAGWRGSSFAESSRDSIPMTGSQCSAWAPEVQEIRLHTELEHRVLYIATFSEGIYVLHAFEKRTRKMPKRDLELARGRLRALFLKRRTDQVTRK